MIQTIIGIKELQKSLKRVSEEANKGRHFTVVRNSRPVFSIHPIVSQKKLPKYTFDDFKKVQFSTKDRDLSKKVDEIVYGTK